MSKQLITDYFYDSSIYDTQDEAYVPLTKPNVPQQELVIPPILKGTTHGNTHYYHLTAQVGATSLLPGPLTETWGYNGTLLGPTIIFEANEHYHLTLTNQLSEDTTFHWHGLKVPGSAIDGGPNAIIPPQASKELELTVDQPAATLWLHPHPCGNTASQVWKGLAAMVIVKDQDEEKLPFPRNYGVDDIPLIFQDRRFHDNQWDYQQDYDADGTQGDVPLVNGTVNAIFTVTTEVLRLRILNGCNRKECRLHFADDLPFTQIASDGGILPEPVNLTRLMLTSAERAEILVDFRHCKTNEVSLYSDDCPILTFKLGPLANNQQELPDILNEIPALEVDSSLPIRRVVMSGMEEMVLLDGKRFDMKRIDGYQERGKVQLWEVTNSNDHQGGMIHPFHIHGCQFQVVSRNGQPPHPNERGWKDTIAVEAQETVQIKVKFEQLGIYMYHCHILEHEDTGMMAQLESISPK